MASAVQNWGEILRTQNLSPGKAMDTVSRWLLITRASVFPMTITSAAIGGLLAIGAPANDWMFFGLAVVGLVLAHAANNMINDYFDLEGGVDSDEYVRAQYAPHPVLSGPAVGRIDESALNEIVVTDTIPLSPDAQACSKIRQLSTASLLAETMRRISDEESVSSLYVD